MDVLMELCEIVNLPINPKLYHLPRKQPQNNLYN